MQLTSILSLSVLAATSAALPQVISPPPFPPICTNAGINPIRAAQVSAAFANAKLVPQAIDYIDPRVEVSVSYGSHAANLGNRFSPVETILRPTIRFTGELDQNANTTKYIIFFVDPDAPAPTRDGTPAIASFFLHQATWNASPSCVTQANNGGGEDITIPGYRPLTPASIAQHRYTQLVYRQPPGFERPSSLALVTARFDLNGFVRDNGLINVGAQYFNEGAANFPFSPFKEKE